MEPISAMDSPPDRDAMVREVLPRLGDGATRQTAESAVTWALEWAATRFAQVLPAVRVEVAESESAARADLVSRGSADRLVGVSEAASILQTSRANVLRWSNGSGRTDFPEPIVTLGCGAHWDREELERYASMDTSSESVKTSG